jgi:hypothetical protein
MNPASSMKTIAAPQRAAFFYPRPVLAHPASNLLLITLDGATRRLLRAPPQIVKHSPDMINVVVHAELAFDHFGHPRASPQISRKASSQRTLQQHRFELAPLTSCELGGASRRGPRPQRLISTASTRGSPPATHAAPVHANTLGHLMRQQAFLEQCQRAKAPTFQLLGASGRSHGAPPTARIGHFLCRNQ